MPIVKGTSSYKGLKGKQAGKGLLDLTEPTVSPYAVKGGKVQGTVQEVVTGKAPKVNKQASGIVGDTGLPKTQTKQVAEGQRTGRWAQGASGRWEQGAVGKWSQQGQQSPGGSYVGGGGGSHLGGGGSAAVASSENDVRRHREFVGSAGVTDPYGYEGGGTSAGGGGATGNPLAEATSAFANLAKNISGKSVDEALKGNRKTRKTGARRSE